MRQGVRKKHVSAIMLFLASSLAQGEPITLERALEKAMRSNPEIASMTAQADSERSMIRSQSWPVSPKIGFMREKNLSLMSQEMGPMDIFSISQEVKFPAKYFIAGLAQKSKATASTQESSAKRLEIRRKVISTYYNLFNTLKILALLNAQRETLREVARTAESRHATGRVTQQDEMKAHVEQTQIETEILVAEEEKIVLTAMLYSLFNEDAKEGIELPKSELSIPKLTMDVDQIPSLALSQSRQIKKAQAVADGADILHQLALWNYAPDFMLSYKRAFTVAPSDNYAFEISMTIPLWFFMKETSEATAASANSVSAQKSLEQTLRETSANLKSLISKVTTHKRLLQIYDTALIPQASSTLSSSQSSYAAGKVGFLELLDSERSLYLVRIAYYRTFTQYIEYLTQLEETVGSSVSSLPFEDYL